MYFVTQQLLGVFRTIKSIRVHRAALWILGEYTFSIRDILSVVDLLKQSLGTVSHTFSVKFLSWNILFLIIVCYISCHWWKRNYAWLPVIKQMMKKTIPMVRLFQLWLHQMERMLLSQFLVPTCK